MSSIETSIRIASGLCNSAKQVAWKLSDPERRAALVILEDCRDRRGLSGVLDQCDLDVLEEMVETWAEIIRRMRGDGNEG